MPLLATPHADVWTRPPACATATAPVQAPARHQAPSRQRAYPLQPGPRDAHGSWGLTVCSMDANMIGRDGSSAGEISCYLLSSWMPAWLVLPLPLVCPHTPCVRPPSCLSQFINWGYLFQSPAWQKCNMQQVLLTQVRAAGTGCECEDPFGGGITRWCVNMYV